MLLTMELEQIHRIAQGSSTRDKTLKTKRYARTSPQSTSRAQKNLAIVISKPENISDQYSQVSVSGLIQGSGKNDQDQALSQPGGTIAPIPCDPGSQLFPIILVALFGNRLDLAIGS